jgi:ribosomal protein uS17
MMNSHFSYRCPFTGNVSIRGRILKGLVVSHKMKRTIVIRRDYLHYIPKYRRFEKRHRNLSVHCSPAFRNVGEGDVVTVGQCRPLSKTVRFNVVEHQPAVNKVRQLLSNRIVDFIENIMCFVFVITECQRQEVVPCLLNLFLSVHALINENIQIWQSVKMIRWWQPSRRSSPLLEN